RPSLYANPEILRAVQAIADRRLADLKNHDWVRRVRRALEPRLASPCQVGEIARDLGTSRRSLQRQLAALGTSFAALLDHVRQERSLELVKDPGVTVASIAAQVGFTDSRAFVRAFRRWTGESPSAFRAKAGEDTAQRAPVA